MILCIGLCFAIYHGQEKRKCACWGKEEEDVQTDDYQEAEKVENGELDNKVDAPASENLI